MSQLSTPPELGIAIAQSRSLVPLAVDALCTAITDTTGFTPDRQRVEYVSLFWLMQFCDALILEGDRRDPGFVEENPRAIPHPASRRERVLTLVGKSSAPILVTSPYLKIGVFSEALAVLQSRKSLAWHSFDFTEIWTGELEANKRVKLQSVVGGEDNVKARILQKLLQMAPVTHLEMHHAMAKWAEKQDCANLQLMYTGNAQLSSVGFMHYSYTQRTRGIRLLVHQHGGGYGIDETHLGEEHDIAVSDVFYTFGWSRPDIGSRVRSLPTAMPQRSRRSGTDELLLMSLPVTSRFYRLQPFLLPTHIARSVDETVAFADGLSASTKLRVRSSGNDRFPLERLAQSSARIMEDTSGGRGSVAASRAKLVIHNYLGTSWLETLAMNIPTVCFYDPAMYRPRAAAHPFIDTLARVGVIHYSGKEAAKFVNSLRGEPSTWWKSAEVQEAREAFVARYANFSDNWLEAWQEEFETLLAE